MALERVFRILPIWRARKGELVSQVPTESGGREQHGTTFKLPAEAWATLESTDRRTLTTLERVARRWDEVYSVQEGEDGEGDFYPSTIGKGDRARSQIKKAAQTNPQILNPRTKVIEDSEGILSSVPMNHAYAAIIQEKAIIKLLESAGDKTRDRQSRNYLKGLARSFRERDFAESERQRQEAEKLWLTRPDEPKIDLFMGFYDANTDKLMGVKYSAEAWLTVLDERATLEAQAFGDAFAQTWSDISEEPTPRYKIRVGWEKFIAGQAAKLDWRANTQPSDVEARQEHGSKITIFQTGFAKTMESINRSYREIVHPGRRNFPAALLNTATLRQYIGHEIAHSIVASKDLDSLLGNHNIWVKELASEVIALDIFAHIPGINTNEKMAAVLSTLAVGVQEYRKVRDEHKPPEYFIMCTSILKYLLTKENLELKDGLISWKNSVAVLRDIHELAQVALKLAKQGTRAEAQRFFDENFDPDLYPYILQGQQRIPDFLRRPDSGPDPSFDLPDPDPAIGTSGSRETETPTAK